MIEALNSFALSHPWVGVVIVCLLGVSQIIKGVRDAIDKTPASDDNAFERIATIVAKASAYLVGFRPKGPDAK